VRTRAQNPAQHFDEALVFSFAVAALCALEVCVTLLAGL